MLFSKKPSKEIKMRRAVEKQIKKCDWEITVNEGIDDNVVSYYRLRREAYEELLADFDAM